eukprot:6534069-Lingulodinium_polyedra.AAC.1
MVGRVRGSALGLHVPPGCHPQLAMRFGTHGRPAPGRSCRSKSSGGVWSSTSSRVGRLSCGVCSTNSW